MKSDRISFTTGGAASWWVSLCGFAAAGWLALHPETMGGTGLAGISAGLVALGGVLNLLFVHRLTVEGDLVTARHSVFRAPVEVRRKDVTHVLLTREQTAVSAGGRSRSDWYVIRVMTSKPIFTTEHYFVPRALVRRRAERLATALDCDFADATEVRTDPVQAGLNPRYLASRPRTVRKAAEIGQAVGDRLRRTGRTGATPAPRGLSVRESERRVTIVLPPTGPGMEMRIALLLGGAMAIGAAVFLWDTRSHVAIVTVAVLMLAAIVAWFYAMPHRITVSPSRIRWTAFPLTRSIRLKVLEELVHRKGQDILLRSDWRDFTLAGSARLTGPQRGWVHSRLELAIADLSVDRAANK